MMKMLNNISCFALVDGILIYTSGKSVYWLDRSMTFDETPFSIIQTKDFVVIITGSNNIGFLLRKEHLNNLEFTWSKVPRSVSIVSHCYKQNQLILFSDIFRDERSWVFSLETFAEVEYEFRMRFVPNEYYVFRNDNPMPIFEGLSRKRASEIHFVARKNQQKVKPHVLGLCNNIVWILTGESDLSGYDFDNGNLFKSQDPYKIIESKISDIKSINFGGSRNHYNFHIDPVEQRIITFANRYYCDINLSDFSIKVVDLDGLPRKLRITKSRWCPEKKWLFFIGSVPDDVFDQHFGIFDTVSEKVIDMERTKDKDEFFGHPPIFDNGMYGVLSTKNVLYLKSIN